MARDLFVVTLGMNFAQACSAREPIHPITLEYPIDGSVR